MSSSRQFECSIAGASRIKLIKRLSRLISSLFTDTVDLLFQLWLLVASIINSIFRPVINFKFQKGNKRQRHCIIVMDAAGIALGALGVFNDAIEWFEWIQLGRGFEKSSEINHLKLQIAQLRLSRWGKSINIDTDDQATLESKLGAENVLVAKKIMTEIGELFERTGFVNKVNKPEDVLDRPETPLCQAVQ
ncbi:hypothetical protein BT63DRAFT_423801 [Microthyrium microscopicum]|uniref:Prion-inhibition and propagation HeLo domain-containing protein n=1 Tax=Microthyrium microscopicum TaxID=703497 RepID=A0A6A6UC12_9PEZI|nr:hypothetical protein BT63DRAFT_423801 [Microthyrium microscopicum]